MRKVGDRSDNFEDGELAFPTGCVPPLHVTGEPAGFVLVGQSAQKGRLFFPRVVVPLHHALPSSPLTSRTSCPVTNTVA
jgi:hypothetical protein